MTSTINTNSSFATEYCRLLCRSMLRAKTIKKGHIFDMAEIKDPFFSLTYIGSNRYGKGIFAKTDIKEDDLIGIFPLVFVPSSVRSVFLKTTDFEKLLKIGRDHLVIYNENYNIFCYSDLITNHACGNHANCTSGDTLLFPELGLIGYELFAREDIKKDQEITQDYGESEYEDTFGFFCKCGAEDCVKRYRGFKNYSVSRQNELLRDNSVDSEIVAELYLDSNSSRRQEIQDLCLSKMSQDERFLFYHHLNFNEL